MEENRITNILTKEIKKNKYDKFIFLCIGSNKLIGDSLGPRVGEILQNNLLEDNTMVIGDMKDELNYLKVNHHLKIKLKQYKFPFIITIDAALSDKEYIGKIVINRRYLEIGKALEKEKYILGNLNIKVITGEYCHNIKKNQGTLENLSEDNIKRMANNIAIQIINGFNK